MKLESRTVVHIGINFIFAPFVYSRKLAMDFHAALNEIDSRFAKFEILDTRFAAVREVPSPFEVSLAVVGQQVGQLLMVASQTTPTFDNFISECDLIAQAFSQLSLEPKQILSRDATMREIYDTSSGHALIEIWEKRLGQKAEDFDLFGRPVLGGGVRLVMPPPANEPDGAEIELKIESLLRDTSKIFLESQFTWRHPSNLGQPFEPSKHLHDIDGFMKTKAVQFLQEKS